MDEFKTKKNNNQRHPRRLRCLRCLRCLFFFFASTLFIAFLQFSHRPLSAVRGAASTTPSWGGASWERRVRASALPRALKASRHQQALSVLVTGAAGFLGTHDSVALRRRGDGVLGLDRFDDSYDPSLKRARRVLLLRAGVFVVNGDLSDPGLLSKLLDVTPFTHVLHLASLPANAPLGHLDPAAFARADADALIALFEAARATDSPPAIVWASSASVYGLNPSSTSAAESDPTDRPATLFAAGKKTAEEIAHAYSHIYGLSSTTLRLFTVYGPWGRPDMAYFTFTKAILHHDPIIVFSNPNGTPVYLDLVYIDDAIAGCLAALDRAMKSGKKVQLFRVYNIGSGIPITVSKLVSMLEGILKTKAERKMGRKPSNGEAWFAHANISLAQRELGYQPKTKLKTGLKRFVRWYLKYYTQSPSSSSSSRYRLLFKR